MTSPAMPGPAMARSSPARRARVLMVCALVGIGWLASSLAYRANRSAYVRESGSSGTDFYFESYSTVAVVRARLAYPLLWCDAHWHRLLYRCYDARESAGARTVVIWEIDAVARSASRP